MSIDQLRQLNPGPRRSRSGGSSRQSLWGACGSDRCDQGGVSKRRAVESYREKKAAAKRLQLSGVPVEQIAEQLNTKVQRVRGWIK